MNGKRLLSILAATMLVFLILPMRSVAPASADTEVLRVVFFALPGYHSIDEDGRRSGYGYEFLQRLSIHGGWTYEYVGYECSHTQALEMLKNGEADIVTSTTKTEEREKDFIFSKQDIGMNSTLFTVKAGNTEIVEGDDSTYDGIRVGMIEGNSKNANFANFAAEHNFEYTEVFYETQTELSAALQAGEVDASVTGSLRLLENEWLIESFDANPFYVCARKDRTELMDRIDKAIAEMDLHDPNWRNELHDTYYSTDLSNDIVMNAEERAFLETLRTSDRKLQVLFDPSASPYSYFDKGEAKGILPALFDLLAERLSIPYEYVSVASREDYLRERASGDADVVLDFAGDYYTAEKDGYKITVPYLQAYFSRLALRDFKGGAKKIAVVGTADAVCEYARRYFSEDAILKCDTTDDCVEAVLKKKADAAILYSYTAQRIAVSDVKNRLATLVLESTSFSYAVGSHVEGGRYLLSLLDKGADSFTDRELNVIIEREVAATQHRGVGLVEFMYQNPAYFILGAVLFLLLLFAIAMLCVRTHNQRKLKAEVASATRALETKTEQLSDALQAADAASRAKTVFLNNMSHDIRTPMNAIIGYTALAASHLENTDRTRDYLSKISQASGHLLSLINDVLDMSRIESGKVTINEHPENLAEILRDLRNIIQSDIHAKHMELFIDTVDVSDENVYCDRLRLNQILLNLTSNAIKFTPTGGKVEICITQKRSQKAGYAVYEFTVTDNGIGMDPEFAKTVFEPFTREQTATVSGIQGSGLGMAITKNIVDMMGGTIGVQSEQGKGTTFTVDLEFKLAGNHSDLAPISELHDYRALVVDDDIICCQSASKMLRGIGLRAEWALSGKEAVARSSEAEDLEDPFAVYIVDWSMPELNGIETVRQIRKLVGDESPIILMSAYDWADIEQEARSAGVTNFISKPLFASELHAILETSLAHDEPAPPPEPEEATVSSGFAGKRILLAEDNELNREIAVEILQEAGFEIECAENGLQACEMLQAAGAGRYDLILMDIQMPIMDGYTATRKIRALQDERLAKIPIVAMTANAFEEDREKAAEAGMDGHLPKPIDIGKMMEVLKGFFPDQK